MYKIKMYKLYKMLTQALVADLVASTNLEFVFLLAVVSFKDFRHRMRMCVKVLDSGDVDSKCCQINHKTRSVSNAHIWQIHLVGNQFC